VGVLGAAGGADVDGGGRGHGVVLGDTGRAGREGLLRLIPAPYHTGHTHKRVRKKARCFIRSRDEGYQFVGQDSTCRFDRNRGGIDRLKPALQDLLDRGVG
jgi:hypothetical protein